MRFGLMHVVSDCVDPGGRPRNHVWTERTVAWYERANACSDYAERVLAAVDHLLADGRTALDVGAGFGALALPLARRLEGVTALEPAPAMARALRRAAARQGLGNVTVVEAAWGHVDIEPHDLVVCAHVGPLLGRDSPFLRALPGLARRAVVLVRDLPGGGDKFFFGELYPKLLGRPYERCGDGEETVAALAALGIVPAITTVEYASDQPFASLEEACDFWMEYMGLCGPEPRAVLRVWLADRLERRGEEWVAPFRKRAAVIHWRVGPR